MSFVEGSVGSRLNIWFQPVSLRDNRFVILPMEDCERDCSTDSNRQGFFRVRLGAGFYAYYLGRTYQYVIQVPESAAGFNVASLRYVNPDIDFGEDGNDIARFEDPTPDSDERVRVTGDTMTGVLVLSEHPTVGSPDRQAATKKYVLDQLNSSQQGLRHEQLIPSNHWVFAHGLTHNPGFTVTDGDGNIRGVGAKYTAPGTIEVFANSNITGVIEVHG